MGNRESAEAAASRSTARGLRDFPFPISVSCARISYSLFHIPGVGALAPQRLYQSHPTVVGHLVVGQYVQVLCHMAGEAREPWPQRWRNQQYRGFAAHLLAPRGVGHALL